MKVTLDEKKLYKTSKFKIGDIVRDDCGCRYKVLKVGRKYYQLLDMETKFIFYLEITKLNKRGTLII